MNGVAVRRDDEAGLKVKPREGRVPLVDVAGQENGIVLADLPQRRVFRPIHVYAGFLRPGFHRVAHGEPGQEVFRQNDQACIRADEALAGCHLFGAGLNR